MAIVGSIQGGLILTSVIALALLGRHLWILPTVALVVALHFYPMPAIFGRTIDYYLGTAMLVAAVIGFVLAAQGADWQVVCGASPAPAEPLSPAPTGCTWFAPRGER